MFRLRPRQAQFPVRSGAASPSRFFIANDVYDGFAERFVALSPGDQGWHWVRSGVANGPSGQCLSSRRLPKLVRTLRKGRQGPYRRFEDLACHCFYEPTVLGDVPVDSRLLSEEPFGPVAPLLRFDSLDEVIDRANSLEYGLAAFAFTASL